MAVSHLTTELSPSSEAVKVAAKSGKPKRFPAYFRAGGFIIDFNKMFDWMMRWNHEFYDPPPETDILEVWYFAGDEFPREWCCKALLLGGLGKPGPCKMFFATRGEEVAPSVLEAGLEEPILEPFEMQANDLAMRDWLCDTASESDSYINPIHEYNSCPCPRSIGIPEEYLIYRTQLVDHDYWTTVKQ